MYSTCLFCNANLGRNEALEHFQVGRRLVAEIVFVIALPDAGTAVKENVPAIRVGVARSR